jgi:hypothetical protein
VVDLAAPSYTAMAYPPGTSPPPRFWRRIEVGYADGGVLVLQC